MEYFEATNFSNQNTTNKEQPLFESDESESEFDAFEHHLSQYDHKDEELFSDEDEPMEHDGDRSATEDDNQISLATSFCKNVQEQNEDFLDAKFNGDQLLDPFSEDKFIKCKYSEDFYVEQCTPRNGRQLFSESEEPGELFNSEQCLGTEPDKQLEERSSEDERVIEKRKRHFLEFISTTRKVCTPSVCGMMQSPDERSPSTHQHHTLIDPNQLATEANEEILFEDDEHELITSTQKDNQSNVHGPLGDRFNWSIDQLATLNPVDISINERRYRRFKEFESDQFTQEKLSKENELFFSQGTIAPSPSRRVFKNIGLGDQSMHEESMRTGSMYEKSSMLSGSKRTGNEKVEGKDSGNYSGEDQRQTMTNMRTAGQQYDEFEFSFMRQPSSKRISNIEFDGDFKMEQQRTTQTPNLRRDSDARKTFSFHLPSDRPAANEWTHLDFKPASSNVLHQTSTPCTLFKLKEFDQFGQPEKAGCRPGEDAGQRSATSSKMPLQERANSVKQKRRLFHHLSSQNDGGRQDSDVTEGMLSIRLSSSACRSNTGSSAIHSNCSNSEVNISNNSFNHSSSHCSSQQAGDEGICESSKEVTFGSSNESSLMSVCDNNSLTPKLRRSRSIAKSFAERLDELELFNDENKSINTNHPEHQSSTRYMHNLTDSNCFMKNFNNFNVHLNNSDSGCYLSNASNGSSDSGGSAVDASGRKRVLFN